MNTFVLEEFERFPLVTFYTVKWYEAEFSETDKFIAKAQSDSELEDDLEDILTLIEDIGEYRGAKDIYFRRHAGKAAELPPLTAFEVKYFHNNLRLFCLKITGNIVVLFNGGKKSSLKTQDSPELNMPFQEAQIFAAKILKALQEKVILIDYATQSLVSGYDDDIIELSWK